MIMAGVVVEGVVHLVGRGAIQEQAGVVVESLAVQEVAEEVQVHMLKVDMVMGQAGQGHMDGRRLRAVEED